MSNNLKILLLCIVIYSAGYIIAILIRELPSYYIPFAVLGGIILSIATNMINKMKP
jgi:Na+/glutamate symporter